VHVTPKGRASKKGGPRQVHRSPPLKHTTAYDNVHEVLCSSAARTRPIWPWPPETTL